jgi:uncharacterized SAM-binding protein YcdF (DUF218 family)
LFLFSTTVLSIYANSFRIDNATKGADCVLILSGNEKTRPDQAARLILEGYSEKLYYTDQKRWNSQHQDILGHPFDKAQEILVTYNLSADIIPSTKEGATSTFDEAYDLVVFLREYPMKHIILVTDTFHTARAHYAFRKVLDQHGHEELKIEMSAAPNDIFDESNWWKSEKGISAYILEPFKYLFYLFNNSNATTIQED